MWITSGTAHQVHPPLYVALAWGVDVLAMIGASIDSGSDSSWKNVDSTYEKGDASGEMSCPCMGRRL